MGDVAVWRVCPGPLLPQLVDLLSEELFCPAGFYDSRNQCMPAPCAPGELYRGGLCEKPECRSDEYVRGESCCPSGSIWNARSRSCSRKPPERPDLAIRKELQQCAPEGGACTFRIVATNDSDVPYTGPILVGDTVSPGAIRSMTGPAGWACGAVSGAISACIDADATLPPRQSVEFKVVAAIPRSALRWSGCAGIKGDAGKDASDANDKSCVNGVNDASTEPGAPDLAARTSVRSCGANQCEFVITVRNVGTADYKGDLRMGEMVGGGTITSLVPFEAGWSLPCQQGPAPPGGTGLVCYRHSTTLQPGDTLTMAVNVAYQSGTRLVGHCAIVDLPPGDANPANNGACAEHRPDDTRSRLVVAKVLKSPCERIAGAGFGYDGWSCDFDTTITNTGPGRFAGDIKLTDTATPGRIVSVRADGADCPNYGTSVLCQWSDKTLASGGSTAITLRVRLPANVPYENCARLDAPASAGQTCIDGLPADDAAPPREASLSDPVCTGGTFLMRGATGPAQCCSLRSIVAGTCAASPAACGEGMSFNLRTGSCERRGAAACADDARLRDGTCCPAGHNVGSEGRCEPLLLCLGGRIVRNGDCVCPPSRRDVDGECTEEEPVRTAEECPGHEGDGTCESLPAVAECTGGRERDAATNQCVCPAGQLAVEADGACRPQRAAQATEECTADQVRVGSRCLSPDPSCAGGMIRVAAGASCTCPRGTVEANGRCETVQARGGTCAGGTRNLLTGQCACPRGTALINEDCVPVASGPGFIPVICPGETRVVGGFCGCPGDMQVQSDSSCACPVGFGIKPGGLTPIGRRDRGLCVICPADQRLTPDGYCAQACPEDLTWICLPPGVEANPAIQGSNCACRSLTPIVQTSAPLGACPRGQIRQFDSCCTPEAIAAGTCGGPPPLIAMVCQPPLVAFGGRCCTRDAIGTARCAAPALGAAIHGGCKRGEIRGDDGRCHTAVEARPSRRSAEARPVRKSPSKSKRR
ncbi:MAG: DUF11 domain-containing protein [Xanthobacteraceae bacterium]|nr:DUF11 domain-containing protein [Xanthobacteraceae bacterium]